MLKGYAAYAALCTFGGAMVGLAAVAQFFIPRIGEGIFLGVIAAGLFYCRHHFRKLDRGTNA